MASKKASDLTVGQLVGQISRLQVNQLLYVLLLIAVFLIGYLLARVQMEGKSVQTAGLTQQQPVGDVPQAPVPPSPEEVLKTLTTGRFPVLGDQNAEVTMVEFSDFECPFCKRYFDETFAQVVKDYVDTGKLKIYFRHFPLDFHPAATPAALAAECANEQGKFWEYHDVVFEQQDKIAGGGETSNAALKKFAADLGLNTSQFNGCFDSAKYQENVTTDTNEGRTVGVSGTPTFYINGRQLVGAQPYSAFQAIIDEELNK